MVASKSKSELIISSTKNKSRTKKSTPFSTTNLPNKSTKLLALAERVARFGSWELDISQPRAVWSPGLFRIFGIKPNVEGLTWEEYTGFIHPDDLALATKNLHIMMQARLNHRENFDYRIIRLDGSVRILHAQRQVTAVSEDGKPTVIVGVDQDVTEQKKAEEALRKSEERFRRVAEVANVMVYEFDVNTRKLRFVSRIEQVTGYKPQEAGATIDWVLAHIHPDDIQRVIKTWDAVSSNPKSTKYVLEYRFLHKNGNYVFLKDTARAIKDASGKTLSFIGGVRDITQREQDKNRIQQYTEHLEELVEKRTKQLVDYERLAAIGQVANMVGHDIRNPLQALTGEVFLIKNDVETIVEDGVKLSVKESLGCIDENISYINKIVADLQDYSKQLNPEYRQVNLEDLIVDSFKTIALPDTIVLSIKIKSVPKVTVDPTFLRRALTNLINNAVQAMPNGGKLTVSGYRQNSNVYITIEDTGVGIPEEIKTKLFTPMFTTKAKGQGLGLAVVKRLVEAQGGDIAFESTVGRGTKFTIKLPL